MKALYLFVALAIMLFGVSALSAAYSTLFDQDFNVSSVPAGWSISGTVGTSHTTVGNAKTDTDFFKSYGPANYLQLTDNAAYNRAWAYNTTKKFNALGKWKITAEVRIGKNHDGSEITNGADGLCFVFLDATTVETAGVFDPSKVTGGYGEFEGAPRGGTQTTRLGYHDGLKGFSLEFDHYNNTNELYREYIHWVDLNDWVHSGLGQDLSNVTSFYYNDGWQRFQVEADAGMLTFSYGWNGSTYASSFTMDTLNPPNTNCDDLYEFDAYFGVCAATGGETAFHDIRMFKVETDPDETLPVELTSFTANAFGENYANLQWVTQSESNLSGYHIYRGNTNVFAEATNLNAFISAYNSSQVNTYSYIDTEIPEPGTYYYWIQSIELNGANELFGPVSLTLNAPGGTTPEIPVVSGIKNVYPNPFNPSTSISFGLKADSHTRLVIYNSRGQAIRSLADSYYTKGAYQIMWDGSNDAGQTCPSGIYTLNLITGKEVSSRKLVLMK